MFLQLDFFLVSFRSILRPKRLVHPVTVNVCTYTTRDRGESTLQQPLLRCCPPSQKKGEENASRYQQKWRPGGLVYRRQEFDRSLSQVLDLVGSGSNKKPASPFVIFCVSPFRQLHGTLFFLPHQLNKFKIKKS